ncbi:MAG: hypothetical protein RR636_12660 [Clostridium sp.]|uniref:hypothetical protein n=1 Tax=Clostridium sp. TaxID=1506 RepID=UPI00302F571A
MDKRQLKNALGLYKIRSKEHNKSLLIACGILLFLFCADMINGLIEVFTFSEDVTASLFQTYSQLSWIVLISITSGSLFWYKTFNSQHEMFPQDNKTRFLSYVMFNYSYLLKLLVLSLSLYLFQYGLFSIIGTFNPNIHFAYPINLDFLISAFIVNFLYGSLFIALIILLGTLDRKFNLYFKITAICIFLLGFIKNGSIFMYIVEFSKFLTAESSLLLFILKAIVLLVVILGLSWIINNSTIYYRRNTKSSRTLTVIATSLLLIVFVSFSVLIPAYKYDSDVTVIEESENKVLDESNFFHDFAGIEDFGAIKVDLSNLKPGDTIEVINTHNSNNNSLPIADIRFASNEVVNNQLYVNYSIPSNKKNWVNLNDYKNPVVTASLDGNKLYINYSYNENQKVLFLSAYGFMSQFHIFKDKGLFKEHIGSMSGSGSGSINIVYPIGFKVITQN